MAEEELCGRSVEIGHIGLVTELNISDTEWQELGVCAAEILGATSDVEDEFSSFHESQEVPKDHFSEKSHLNLCEVGKVSSSPQNVELPANNYPGENLKREFKCSGCNHTLKTLKELAYHCKIHKRGISVMFFKEGSSVKHTDNSEILKITSKDTASTKINIEGIDDHRIIKEVSFNGKASLKNTLQESVERNQRKQTIKKKSKFRCKICNKYFKRGLAHHLTIAHTNSKQGNSTNHYLKTISTNMNNRISNKVKKIKINRICYKFYNKRMHKSTNVKVSKIGVETFCMNKSKNITNKDNSTVFHKHNDSDKRLVQLSTPVFKVNDIEKNSNTSKEIHKYSSPSDSILLEHISNEINIKESSNIHDFEQENCNINDSLDSNDKLSKECISNASCEAGLCDESGINTHLHSQKETHIQESPAEACIKNMSVNDEHLWIEQNTNDYNMHEASSEITSSESMELSNSDTSSDIQRENSSISDNEKNCYSQFGGNITMEKIKGNNSKDIQNDFPKFGKTLVESATTPFNNLKEFIGTGEDKSETNLKKIYVTKKENSINNRQNICIAQDTNDHNMQEVSSEMIISNESLECPNSESSEKIKGNDFYDNDFFKTSNENLNGRDNTNTQLVSHHFSKAILNNDINNKLNISSELSEIDENLQNNYLIASNIKNIYNKEFQYKKMQDDISHTPESIETPIHFGYNMDQNISPNIKYHISLNNEVNKSFYQNRPNSLPINQTDSVSTLSATKSVSYHDTRHPSSQHITDSDDCVVAERLLSEDPLFIDQGIHDKINVSAERVCNNEFTNKESEIQLDFSQNKIDVYFDTNKLHNIFVDSSFNTNTVVCFCNSFLDEFCFKTVNNLVKNPLSNPKLEMGKNNCFCQYSLDNFISKETLSNLKLDTHNYSLVKKCKVDFSSTLSNCLTMYKSTDIMSDRNPNNSLENVNEISQYEKNSETAGEKIPTNVYNECAHSSLSNRINPNNSLENINEISQYEIFSETAGEKIPTNVYNECAHSSLSNRMEEQLSETVYQEINVPTQIFYVKKHRPVSQWTNSMEHHIEIKASIPVSSVEDDKKTYNSKFISDTKENNDNECSNPYIKNLSSFGYIRNNLNGFIDIKTDTGFNKEFANFSQEYSQKEYSPKNNSQKEHPQKYLNNKYQCSVCKKCLTTKPSLKIHMRIHTGERPFSCDKCNYGAVTLGNLRNHKKNIHESSIENNKTISRSRWGQAQVNIPNIETQTNIDTMVTSTEDPVIIESTKDLTVQGKGFQDFYCAEHLNDKDESSKNIDFNVIQDTGKNFSSENINDQSKDTFRRKFTCSFCSKSLTTSAGLTIHKRIHTGDRPFECNICHYKAVTKGNLRKHMNIHGANHAVQVKMEASKENVMSNVKNGYKEKNVLHNKEFSQDTRLTSTTNEWDGDLENVMSSKDYENASQEDTLLINLDETTEIFPFEFDFEDPLVKEMEKIVGSDTDSRLILDGVKESEADDVCSVEMSSYIDSNLIVNHTKKIEINNGNTAGDHLGKAYSISENTKDLKSNISSDHDKMEKNVNSTFPESNKRKYECLDCCEIFSVKKSLKRHLKKRNDGKQFECNDCDYKCCTRRHFKSHEMSHIKEIETNNGYNNELGNLGKSNSISENTKDLRSNILSSHDKLKNKMNSTFSESNERKYGCSDCCKIFSSGKSLNKHLKNRIDGKLYECKDCDYKCCTKRLIKSHKNNHYKYKNVYLQIS